MSNREYDFVDWRPVTSVPFKPRIMSSNDWQKLNLSGPLLEDIRGEISDISVQFRYACRSDGLILFTVSVPTSSRRTAIRLGRAAAYRIKEICGHHHIFDNPNWAAYDTELTIQPVLCAPQDCDKLSALEAKALDGKKLAGLSAVSAKTGLESETPAILTLKMFYSRLFDRVSSMADRRGSAVEASVSASRRIARTKGRAWLMLGIVVTFFASLGLLWANAANDWGAVREILASSFVLLAGFLALTHAQHHIGQQLNQTIRLHRSLIAHCAHGNTLCRVLNTFYLPDPPPPGPEYDSVIRLSQDMIDALVRRINYYYFSFSAVVALFAIIMSFLT